MQSLGAGAGCFWLLGDGAGGEKKTGARAAPKKQEPEPGFLGPLEPEPLEKKY